MPVSSNITDFMSYSSSLSPSSRLSITTMSSIGPLTPRVPDDDDELLMAAEEEAGDRGRSDPFEADPNSVSGGGEYNPAQAADDETASEHSLTPEVRAITVPVLEAPLAARTRGGQPACRDVDRN